MKNFTKLLIVLLIAISSQAQKNVVLNIYKKLGSNTFAINQVGQNSLVQNFKITRMDFYLSGFTIIHDGGLQTIVPAGKYVLVRGNANETIDLGIFNVTNVEGIKFYVGVESPTNNSDPSLWPSTHPLAPKVPSMQWGWSAGYRFVALEGKAGGTFATTFEMHALGNINYAETTVLAQAVNLGNIATININADYSQALRGINVNSGPIDHGTNATDLTVIQNMKNNVFTASPATLSITNNFENTTIKIYPNPSNGMVSLSINSGLNKFTSATIVDLTGKLVQTISINNESQVDFNINTKGFYFIKFYEGSINTFNHKLVIN